MAGMDLSSLFEGECDRDDSPLAAGILFVSDESAEVSNELDNASTVLIGDSNDGNAGHNQEQERLVVIEVQEDNNTENIENVADNSVFSPDKRTVPALVQGKTSTPMRSEPQESAYFSGTSVQNVTTTPTTSNDQTNLSQLTHISNTPTTPVQSRFKHPKGWSMLKRRPANETNPSSQFVIHPVPNYRSSIQRNQPYPQIRVQRNQPDVSAHETRALAFVFGATNTVPQPDLPDDDPETEISEEEQQLTNQLKEMLAKGDIASWEYMVDQLSYVRGNYSKNNDANYFHDRARVLPRLKATYDSLNLRPTLLEFEETPKLMKKELKKHQKSGLKFMLWRETQDPHGGILADDMGLGKTISVVALVAATLYDIPKCNMTLPRGIRHKGNTLVICPPNLTNQWAEEFMSSSRCIRVLVHHGSTKALKIEELLIYHVVITSYNIVTNEHIMGPNMIFKIFWKRIVLDEGHYVRNYMAQQSKAVCNLYGKMKWILTGTPIHNRIDDLYPYLVFLGVDPFNERNIFLKWAKDREGHARLNVILKSIMLRRTKEELNTLTQTKFVENFEYELEQKENECYKRLMALSQSMMKIFLNHRSRKNGGCDIYHDKNLYKIQAIIRKRMNGYVEYTHIFVLLLRLRQLCSHPVLISPMLTHDAPKPTEDEEDQDFTEEEANVMGQILNDAVSEKDIFNVKNEIFNEDRPSTKIQMLLFVLQKRFLNTKDKGLIVCEWPSFLRIIADHLSLIGLSYDFYTGDVPMQERPEVLRKFNSESMHPRVLLLSINCGGVGLNLARANHIFLMCTHWNPQMELQAEDRSYRIGQDKDVYVYKFRAQGTIEERIFNLQQEKLRLADKMLVGASANNYRLTIQDLKTLFGI